MNHGTQIVNKKCLCKPKNACNAKKVDILVISSRFSQNQIWQHEDFWSNSLEKQIIVANCDHTHSKNSK